ncbi:MAG: BatD family protein [Polyangiaceae bacterium]
MNPRGALVSIVTAAVLLSAPRAAVAAGSVSLQVSTHKPEVGEAFTVQLVALVDRGSTIPQSPKLRTAPGLTTRGPDISTQTRVNIVGGQVIAKIGIAATWTVTASKPGTYTLGPGSIIIDGKQQLTKAVSVNVVPAQAKPRAPGFDPFDPFSFPGMPKIPGLTTDDEEDNEDELSLLPPFPEEFRLGRPLDAVAFLRAEVSPRRAVVGEQVTLAVYAYGKRGPFRETHTSEPSREAFLAYTLLENSYAEPLYRVPVGENVWHAKKIRELALFPISAGKLTIGAMRMGFEGRGYASDGPHRGLVRYSNALELEVSEPPVSGRPPGYRIGDVGRYTLTASVTPREIVAGESVSIVARLEGTGNVPYALRIPQQHDVEWLEPNIVDDVSARGSTIGGKRTFSYVVRVDKAGDVDLGQLSLPYWDPERGRYEVAQTALGNVKVGAGSKQAAAEPAKADPLSALATPRTALRPLPSQSSPASRNPWFFPVLFAPPLLVVSAWGARRGMAHLRRRAESRAGDLARRARQALVQAKEADKADANLEVASHVERAVFLAIEHGAGLRARAVLRDELLGQLRERDVKEELADAVIRTLAACDDVRFAGESASDLLSSGREVVSALLDRASVRGGS